MAESSIAHRLTAQLGSSEADDLVSALASLVDGAMGVLGENLLGVYLSGSFALGAGDMASDVDFLVVTNRPLSEGEELGARRVHAGAPERDNYWSRHLEGSWVDRRALADAVGAHPPWLSVDNGSRVMEQSRHDDCWNVRWVLRAAGIALVGPPAQDLVSAVDEADIRAEAVDQADAKLAWVRDDPAALLDGWAQPYVVLTFCRLLWAATFGTIATKNVAAEWVRQENAPEEFGELLRSSITYRRRAFDTAANRADPSLIETADSFVTWAAQEVHERVEGSSTDWPSR